MRVWPILTALSLLLALFGAGSSSASVVVYTPRLDETLSLLVTQGKIKQARMVLEKSDPSPTDRLFFRGMVMKINGRFSAAIADFVRVLMLEPNRLNARRELAHTLMLAGRLKASEYYFRQLLKIDGNQRMRAGYRRFLAEIDQNKPVGFSVQFSLLPSTNINRGTTNNTLNTVFGKFTVAPTSKPSSGVGAKLGISGFYRRGLGRQSRFIFDWGLSGLVYPKKLYDSATGSISLSYQRVTRHGQWSVTPYARHYWRQDKGGYDSAGINLAISTRISAKNSLAFGLVHEYRNFAYQKFENGAFSRATVGFQRQLTPGLSVSAGLGTEQSRPRANHLKYAGYDLSVGINKEWNGGLVTGLGVAIGNRRFVGIFPLKTSPRRDRYSRTSITIYDTRFAYKGMTPKLTCAYSRSRSNIALYTYGVTECDLTGQILF